MSDDGYDGGGGGGGDDFDYEGPGYAPLLSPYLSLKLCCIF
jgi:hypothetical protein